jgi:hypothetical protein
VTGIVFALGTEQPFLVERAHRRTLGGWRTSAGMMVFRIIPCELLDIVLARSAKRPLQYIARCCTSPCRSQILKTNHDTLYRS